MSIASVQKGGIKGHPTYFTCPALEGLERFSHLLSGDNCVLLKKFCSCKKFNMWLSAESTGDVFSSHYSFKGRKGLMGLKPISSGVFLR